MSEASKPEPEQIDPLPQVRARRRWVSLLLGLVIFGSGFAVGAGTAGIALRNLVLQRLHHPEKGPPVMAALLQRKLDLTEAQRARVEEVLFERQAALIAIRREFQPRAEAELDLLDAQIVKLLNNQQQQVWRDWFWRMRRTWIPPVPAQDPGAEQVSNE